MRQTRLTIAVLTGLCALVASGALADTKAGVDAWSRGDYSTAVREWEAEAARGDADALFNLGQAYKLGRGVKQDLARAEQLYAEAAAKGHLQASDNQALLLFQRGERERAMPMLEAAAARGDARAQYLVGLAHFNGDLAAKDWVRAYALVSLAQQQGLAQAAPAMAQMDQYIPLDQRQQGVALAAELQDRVARNRASQLAAQDLGTADPSPGSSPATAGADYARPAVVATRPAMPVASTAPAAPKPATIAVPASAKKAAPAGPWRVQLGAFAVAANADALWARVKGRAELAGHPRGDLRAGKTVRLTATGFATQAAAQAACARLTAGGFACLAFRD